MEKLLRNLKNPEIQPNELKAIIQSMIDGSFSHFDPEKMANYDADFNSEEPYFINIWSKQRGYGFGYLVFHHFLSRVGINKTFLSSNFTNDGLNLFQKAVNDGLIEKVGDVPSLQRLTRWKVVGNPIENLKKILNRIL